MSWSGLVKGNEYRPTFRVTMERMIDGKPGKKAGDKAVVLFDVPFEYLPNGQHPATKALVLYIESIGGKILEDVS